MMAAEPDGPDNSGPTPVPRSDMEDAPAQLASAYPLHAALRAAHELVVPAHARAEREAQRLAARRRSLGLWAGATGGAAVVLLAAELAIPAVGASPAGMLAVRIGEAVATAAALVALAWRAAVSVSRNALLERHRAERCRLLKFRFLIDPNLWTRRGNEAAERRGRFETDAAEIRGLDFSGLRDWAAKDTAPFAPTLPVGSNIDPHTVHTLVDYYQERRLNPQLLEVEREIGRSAVRDAGRVAARALFVAAVVFVAVRLVLGYPALGLPLAPAARAGWAAVAAALAVALPAIALALVLFRNGPGVEIERLRLVGRHHALTEISGRLQKASGTEAIFHELGFCEDVLETQHREWLRGMLASV